jgi:hypothetical protein
MHHGSLQLHVAAGVASIPACMIDGLSQACLQQCWQVELCVYMHCIVMFQQLVQSCFLSVCSMCSPASDDLPTKGCESHQHNLKVCVYYSSVCLHRTSFMTLLQQAGTCHMPCHWLLSTSLPVEFVGSILLQAGTLVLAFAADTQQAQIAPSMCTRV